MLYKLIKVVLAVLGLPIAAAALGLVLFVNLAPQFGAQPTGEHLARIAQSQHYQNGEFVNLVTTELNYSCSNMAKMIRDFLTVADISPTQPLPVKFAPNPTRAAADSLAYITWYGHSAFLVEIEGKRILLDPMFGPAAAPVGFLSRRYPYEQPLELAQFTAIDAVLISHDHYDHLDYSSIKKLKAQVNHFFVPLGVGAHLRRWDVDAAKITELDWWQSADLAELSLTATPARHFSGRAINDSKKTQWASWVLKSRHNKLYFSGDGGYGEHFAEIGQKYGPFDLTMLECGQYNQNWADIHMMPEQTAQANIDLGGKVMMPIHWGAFDLSLHHWQEPVLRLLAAAQKLEVEVVTPFIGERFAVGRDFPKEKWWERAQ